MKFLKNILAIIAILGAIGMNAIAQETTTTTTATETVAEDATPIQKISEKVLPTEESVAQEEVTEEATPKAADSSSIVEHLQQQLADHYALNTKTLNFHWNITGSNFYDLHKLFYKFSKSQQKTIEKIAERILALGNKVENSLQYISSKTVLSEEKNGSLGERDMLKALLKDYQSIRTQLKNDVLFISDTDDDATYLLLTKLIYKYEKTIWKLKALLSK